MTSKITAFFRSLPPQTPELRHVLAGSNPNLAAWLETTRDDRSRTDQLSQLSDAEVRSLVTLMDPTSAAELLGTVDPHAAANVVRVSDPSVAAGLIDSVESDEAADIMRVLPDSTRAALLAEMPVTKSAVVRGLLSWPDESAAARMNPDVVTVQPTMSVREAVSAIKTQTAAVESGEVYVTTSHVTDVGTALLGAVSYRDLVLAEPERMIDSLMRENVTTVEPTTDQEAAAHLLHRQQLSSLPVISEGQLLGVLTPDDVADIIEEEATEDASLQGGTQPLDVPYLRATPWQLWRKRIVWLLVLFLAEMYTGTVLRAFESELETAIALAAFIPLLIGTGGNTGTQITTTLIRAMAVGEVRFRDVGRVLRKEITTGMMVAVTIATIGWIRAWTLGVGQEVALTVAVTMAAVVLWSAIVASILPLALRRFGIDPAVVSAPMITTIVDGTGLIIYFEVAKLLISTL